MLDSRIMWITILKFTRWIYKTLNADMRAWQVGLGITLGALAGLLPFGLATLFVFTLMLAINLHFGSALFSFGIFKLMAVAVQGPVIRPLGDAALEAAPQAPLIALAQTPVLSWLRLDYNDVAGAIALWLILALPLMALGTWAWDRFQNKFREKLANSRAMKWLSRIWLFKVIRYVFIGSTA